MLSAERHSNLPSHAPWVKIHNISWNMFRRLYRKLKCIPTTTLSLPLSKTNLTEVFWYWISWNFNTHVKLLHFIVMRRNEVWTITVNEFLSFYFFALQSFKNLQNIVKQDESNTLGVCVCQLNSLNIKASPLAFWLLWSYISQK